HFENLGLFEMIRRRCRCIVVSDASYDPNHTFGDLGNAVRKIAIDLGIEIRFDQLSMLKRHSEADSATDEGPYYSVGVIDYKNAPGACESNENGLILYIKPTFHGTESVKVTSYAALHPMFPHEITWYQDLGEVQFEAYRA